LACAEALGGQGLPQLLDAALQEMLYASNHAWAMYTGIAGAYLCLKTHAAPWLQARYLPDIVSGQACPPCA
jgi:alkylation response protein AidB-like acyl-CoA dehydrogenase